MLNAKKVLTKLMRDMFRGADPSQVISLGNPAAVTPTRDGWLVVQAETDNGVSIAPIIRLTAGGRIVAEQTGITYAGSAAFLSCAVKKGVSYTITTYRCSRIAVWLY